MSGWQAYLKPLELCGIHKAAIFSIQGDSVWAVCGGFTAKPDEIKAIVSGFLDDSPLHGTGIIINGEKYMCMEAGERRIYGRKGKEGICCVRTKSAVVVAHHPESVQRGQATTAVENIADQLLKHNY